ncbi:hypothetical protein MMMDOFMJ_0226 [Methylobacterium gnaphalii]|uniref:Uncharacterized protein n=1 Tax=Methylobacterium gnaphalii TaxID=1010610 RepID=A0A512JIS1_9HYPH|nr:hypothetical protein MGN01_16170 [Methylobacterium gnaphalii]GJD67312.1 hypothetical protein MMMDOFMJ_0226 [Methylobacterium gnaphalii]GLS49802.1 hypothetical protein GCM10007885_26540 [Methylobacterium gnaphalii]
MPDVPNDRSPEDTAERKPERRPGERSDSREDKGGLAQSPPDPTIDSPRRQDGPMDRPGTEAEERSASQRN